MRPYDFWKSKVQLSRYIKVKGQYEGFHTYENAPEEVAFLKNNHRHIFKWECVIEVFHDDRELEFFIVKNKLEREILAFTRLKANLGSCEQQAEEILKGLVNIYGAHRYYIIEVSEDGENGGFVEWDPRDISGRVSGIREDNTRQKVSESTEHPTRGSITSSEGLLAGSTSGQRNTNTDRWHHR